MTGVLLSLFPLAAAGCLAWLYWNERRNRIQIERRLRQAEVRLSETQTLARIGTWEFDIQTDEISWSEETFHIFGFPPGGGEPDFADILLSIHPEDSPVFDRAIQRAITAQEVYRLDLRIRTPEQATKYIHAQGSPVLGADGEVQRIIGTVLDITERKQGEQQLVQDATRDALTGLANRRQLSGQLQREIEIARRNQTPLTLCMCDLDEFKRVNDSYGHLMGDQVLTEYARIITGVVRQTDLAARFGGDEFCIVFLRATAVQAQSPVERIRTILQNRAFTTTEGKPFHVTATFGLAELRAGMDDVGLIAAADSALYEAKKQGRNRFHIAA